jgi:hypothetical protein
MSMKTVEERIKALEAEVQDLRHALVVVLNAEAKAGRGSVRRLINMTEREKESAELFEGLAADLQRESGQQ